MIRPKTLNLKLVKLSLIISLFCVSSLAVNAGKVFYKILDYCAKGDEKTTNTNAIYTAIETAAKNGGGTV